MKPADEDGHIVDFVSNQYVVYATIIVVALVFWCALTLLRQRRVRDLAASLGGHYVSDGALKIGHVEGTWQGREFAVATSGSLTSIFVRCDNKGVPLCVSNRFFRDYPNWSYIFAIGDRRERVLIREITRKRVVIPLPEELRPKVESLFGEVRDALDLDDRRMLRGTLWVLHRQIEYRCAGVLTDARRVGRVLNYMHEVGIRLQFMPVE